MGVGRHIGLHAVGLPGLRGDRLAHLRVCKRRVVARVDQLAVLHAGLDARARRPAAETDAEGAVGGQFRCHAIRVSGLNLQREHLPGRGGLGADGADLRRIVELLGHRHQPGAAHLGLEGVHREGRDRVDARIRIHVRGLCQVPGDRFGLAVAPVDLPLDDQGPRGRRGNQVQDIGCRFIDSGRAADGGRLGQADVQGRRGVGHGQRELVGADGAGVVDDRQRHQIPALIRRDKAEPGVGAGGEELAVRRAHHPLVLMGVHRAGVAEGRDQIHCGAFCHAAVVADAHGLRRHVAHDDLPAGLVGLAASVEVGQGQRDRVHALVAGCEAEALAGRAAVQHHRLTCIADHRPGIGHVRAIPGVRVVEHGLQADRRAFTHTLAGAGAGRLDTNHLLVAEINARDDRAAADGCDGARFEVVGAPTCHGLGPDAPQFAACGAAQTVLTGRTEVDNTVQRHDVVGVRTRRAGLQVDDQRCGSAVEAPQFGACRRTRGSEIQVAVDDAETARTGTRRAGTDGRGLHDRRAVVAPELKPAIAATEAAVEVADQRAGDPDVVDDHRGITPGVAHVDNAKADVVAACGSKGVGVGLRGGAAGVGGPRSGRQRRIGGVAELHHRGSTLAVGLDGDKSEVVVRSALQLLCQEGPLECQRVARRHRDGGRCGLPLLGGKGTGHQRPGHDAEPTLDRRDSNGR